MALENNSISTAIEAFQLFGHSNPNTSSSNQSNGSRISSQDCGSNRVDGCIRGHIIPFLESSDHMSSAARAGWAILIVLFMSYLFFGVSIISDKFVESIEIVVTQKRKVKRISKETGAEEVRYEPVWNETINQSKRQLIRFFRQVALVVVGSSSPEIMLASIEVFTHNFSLGHLGPATIIGSGAYNLFIITGLCISAVPGGQSRRIKDLHIFFVTGAWSIFAYIWIYLILSVMSPGVIEVWEAVMTLCFFPISIFSSYLANKRCFSLKKTLVNLARRTAIVNPAGNTDPPTVASNLSQRLKSLAANKSLYAHSRFEGLRRFSVVPISQTPQISAAEEEEDETSSIDTVVEKYENKFLEFEADLKMKHPEKSTNEIYELAELELVKTMPKTRSYYRTQTIRKFTGNEDIMNQKKLKETISMNHGTLEASTAEALELQPNEQVVSFEPSTYTVLEDCGSFNVTVVRQGVNLNNEISVGYATEDGTGKAGVDFQASSGWLSFEAGEQSKIIKIDIIDDEVFNEDTIFYVNLHSPKMITAQHHHHSVEKDKINLHLGSEPKATITKLDDDHGGLFHFKSNAEVIEENAGEVEINVVRSSGGKGDVIVPVSLSCENAFLNKHFKVVGPLEVKFSSRQAQDSIKLIIVDEGKLDKNVKFDLILDEPRWDEDQRDEGIDTEQLGKPRLKPPTEISISITESSRLKKIVDGIARMDVYAELISNATYSQQFKAAITVSNGSADNCDDPPKWYHYVLHVVAFPWKILVAMIPPNTVFGGWLAAICCLALIAFVTVMVEDLANHLGCAVGLRKNLTAITFVALGVTLPDLFASRIAAKNEETADAAIGHICGTAAANVFFGIGLAWTIAAVKNRVDGRILTMNTNWLAFNVTIYYIFASVAFSVLLLRRLHPVCGELGGPRMFRVISVTLFITMWCSYVGLSALKDYCVILSL